MQHRFSKALATNPAVRYIGGTPDPAHPVLIDCGEGVNPFGIPPTVQPGRISWEDSFINLYPHDTALFNAIQSYWSPYIRLAISDLHFTAGSIDGMYAANLLFQNPGAIALGLSPQFPDYGCNARQLGYDYRTVLLDPDTNYKIDANAVIAGLIPGAALLYLDNPHNPTGQVISKADIAKIATAAEALNITLVVDEAYGDYMPEENSAITLLRQFDNLMVLRTFSKGWGLAGLRAGYCAASPAMMALLERQRNPYYVSAPDRALAAAAMQTANYPAQCRERVAAIKRHLIQALPPCLTVAETALTCPISLFIHRDASVDLAALLLEHGVAAISGSSFTGLGGNCVRLHVPNETQIAALCKVLSSIS